MSTQVAESENHTWYLKKPRLVHFGVVSLLASCSFSELYLKYMDVCQGCFDHYKKNQHKKITLSARNLKCTLDRFTTIQTTLQQPVWGLGRRLKTNFLLYLCFNLEVIKEQLYMMTTDTDHIVISATLGH